MVNRDLLSADGRSPQRRMQLRYGFNEIYGWWHLSAGPHREEVQRRLRLMDTAVVRIFVFDQPVPDPIKNWGAFAGCVQAVLDVGAVPMVTFAKFQPPYDNPAALRDFVQRSVDVVWGCLEQWGGDVVRDWQWGIWNEPNNLIIGGDLTFAQYRTIYEAVAVPIYELLEPHLKGQKARIGGPAIDGTHRAYWLDWIARLVHEVDDRLVGFASWHRYGDWRPAVSSESLALEMWGSPDSPNGPLFQELLMAQTPTYEARARRCPDPEGPRCIQRVRRAEYHLAPRALLHARHEPECAGCRLLHLGTDPSPARWRGPGIALDRDSAYRGLWFDHQRRQADARGSCQAGLRPARSLWRSGAFSGKPSGAAGP